MMRNSMSKAEANDGKNTVEQCQKEYQDNSYCRDISSNKSSGAAPVEEKK